MRSLNLTIQKIEEFVDNDWLKDHDEPSLPHFYQEIHCSELSFCYEEGKFQIFSKNQLLELNDCTNIIWNNYKIKVALKERGSPSDFFQNSFSSSINLPYIIPGHEKVNEQSHFSQRADYGQANNPLHFLHKGQPLSTSLIPPKTRSEAIQSNIHMNQEDYPSTEANYPFPEHNFIRTQDQEFPGFFLTLSNFFKEKIFSKLKILLSSIFIFSLIGCSSEQLSEMKVTINAAKDLNPDINGTSTPVVIMLFQLKQASKFKKAGYFDLYDNAAEVLSDTYIEKYEVEIRPGEHISKTIALSVDSKYVGILAAFHDIKKSRWKAIIEINEDILDSLILNVNHFKIEKLP